MKEVVDLGLTVETLAMLCAKQIEEGNGKKYVLLSGDDEGNFYHTLFYDFTTKESAGEEGFKELLTHEHNHTHTVDNCVILG